MKLYIKIAILSMKTSRKNPFAQATVYKAPINRVKDPFENLAWEEPVFTEIKATDIK